MTRMRPGQPPRWADSPGPSGLPRRHLRPQQRRPPRQAPPPATLAPAQLAALVAREALQATVIAQMAHGLCMFDADDRLLMANQRFREIWRLPAALCQPGMPFQTIIAASHGARLVADALLPAADEPQIVRRRREWLLDDQRIIEVHTARLASGVVVALHADITAQRQAQQQVEHLAHHDALTGLPNRGSLHAEIQRQLPRTSRGEALALLCLDLDRFKPVNDMLGHDAGDALLRQVAQRLRHNLRETDCVARLGGDEFAILQTGAEQPAAATGLARRVIAALAEPFDLDGHQVHIGTSVGVAIAPGDGDKPDALLKSADLALYLAKSAGRGVLRFFEPGLDARMQLRRQLEADLRGALGRGEFSLAYQAQVALPGRQVVGAEALIRWAHPQRGPVSPAEFIGLAEETGLILAIGRWVLQQACRDAMAWPQPLRVAVNVSPLQFKSRALLQEVLDALAASGLPPQRLELEITEAVLLDDTDQVLSLLHALRARGIRIALDDFGTGYASLSYLRRFPFDKLKIDRSFVGDACRGGHALNIIGAICGLAQGLGMATTAEGVETADQLQAVQAAGCSEVQGFLFSRPGPAAGVAALCAQPLSAASAGPASSGMAPSELAPSRPTPL